MLKRITFVTVCFAALTAMHGPAKSQAWNEFMNQMQWSSSQAAPGTGVRPKVQSKKSPSASRAIQSPFNMQVGAQPPTNSGNAGVRTKPPKAYAGSNPNSAAKAQDKSARYTQFIQMSTQLMNELQNTERELVGTPQSRKGGNKLPIKKQGSPAPKAAPSQGLYGIGGISQRSYEKQ